MVLKDANEIAWSVSSFFMFNTQMSDTIARNPIVEENIENYSRLFPPKQTLDKPLIYDIEVSPSRFLPFMVKINQYLEYLFPGVDGKH